MSKNNSEHRVMHSYYQKGYADGYKRHKDHSNSQREEDYEYMYNVLIVIIVFGIFMIAIVYAYSKNAGINSHYDGDCLLDIATSYQPRDCLIN